MYERMRSLEARALGFRDQIDCLMFALRLIVHSCYLSDNN